MSDCVRVGLIGCGDHGRGVLSRALAAVGDAELVSCADVDEAAAEQTAREFGYARHYRDYGEMLSKEELDGVVVALPHYRLAGAAIAAAAAGCDVFVEKPVGVNKAQALELREAAARADVKVMVGYCLRFDPARRALKSLIERGALGEIAHVSAGKCSGLLTGWTTDPAKGGGPLLWVGVHMTDQVLWMAGSAPERVYGEVRWHPEYGTDLSAGYTIRFENGVIAALVCAQELSSPVDYIEVLGSKGRARAEWPSGTLQVESELATEYRQPTTIRPEMPSLVPLFEDEMGAWVRSISQGREPPIGIDAGINVLAVIDAVVESGRTGAPVALVG
jgi:predicted dehydrogenase